MKRDKNLISKKLPLLKRFTFYRQRFDACPHFMFFVGDAHGSDTNHGPYPFGQRITCAFFSKNKADWYHPFIELEYTAEKITNLAKTNPKIAKDLSKIERIPGYAIALWKGELYGKSKRNAFIHRAPPLRKGSKPRVTLRGTIVPH
jgi:hypothetical protein